MVKAERVENKSKREDRYPQYLRKLKSRQERHTAKASLRRGETIEDMYEKHQEWES